MCKLSSSKNDLHGSAVSQFGQMFTLTKHTTMQKQLLTLLSLLIFSLTHAQVGKLDSSYGDNGLKKLEEPIDMTSFELLKSFPAEDGG